MTTEQHWAGKMAGRILPKKLAALSPLFLLTVVLPVLCAVIYYGLIASDVYVSESRYVVRTQGKQTPVGLAAILGGDASAFGGGEGASANNYITSRDALKALNAKGEIRDAYARPDIDAFGRLTSLRGPVTQEDLYKHFSRYVTVEEDTHSGITTLIVRAYRPEDAQKINGRLLELAEKMVNSLSKRSREDLVRYVRNEVIEAREQAQRASVALAQFRIRNGVIDPERQGQVSLEMISKLQDQVIVTKTQLDQMRSFTPANPQIPILADRLASLDAEMKAEFAKLVGAGGSLAAKNVEYTKLVLESQFADKYLTTALASLQNASNEARHQQAYVQRIVQPNLPDDALEPRRMRSIFAVLVLGLVAWGVLTMLFSAMREHSL